MNQAYVLDDHDEERQFNAKSLVALAWASDVVGTDISAHDFEHT